MEHKTMASASTEVCRRRVDFDREANNSKTQLMAGIASNTSQLLTGISSSNSMNQTPSENDSPHMSNPHVLMSVIRALQEKRKFADVPSSSSSSPLDVNSLCFQALDEAAAHSRDVKKEPSPSTSSIPRNYFPSDVKREPSYISPKKRKVMWDATDDSSDVPDKEEKVNTYISQLSYDISRRHSDSPSSSCSSMSVSSSPGPFSGPLSDAVHRALRPNGHFGQSSYGGSSSSSCPAVSEDLFSWAHSIMADDCPKGPPSTSTTTSTVVQTTSTAPNTSSTPAASSSTAGSTVPHLLSSSSQNLSKFPPISINSSQSSPDSSLTSSSSVTVPVSHAGSLVSSVQSPLISPTTSRSVTIKSSPVTTPLSSPVTAISSPVSSSQNHPLSPFNGMSSTSPVSSLSSVVSESIPVISRLSLTSQASSVLSQSPFITPILSSGPQSTNGSSVPSPSLSPASENHIHFTNSAESLDPRISSLVAATAASDRELNSDISESKFRNKNEDRSTLRSLQNFEREESWETSSGEVKCNGKKGSERGESDSNFSLIESLSSDSNQISAEEILQFIEIPNLENHEVINDSLNNHLDQHEIGHLNHLIKCFSDAVTSFSLPEHILDKDNFSPLDILDLYCHAVIRLFHLSFKNLDFVSLPPADQVALLDTFALKSVLCMSFFAFKEETNSWVFPADLHTQKLVEIKLSDLNQVIPNSFLQRILAMNILGAKLRLDWSIGMLLIGAFFYCPLDVTIQNIEAIDKLRDRYMEILFKYLKWKHGVVNASLLYPEILKLMDALLKDCTQMEPVPLPLNAGDVRILEKRIGSLNANCSQKLKANLHSGYFKDGVTFAAINKSILASVRHNVSNCPSDNGGLDLRRCAAIPTASMIYSNLPQESEEAKCRREVEALLMQRILQNKSEILHNNTEVTPKTEQSSGINDTDDLSFYAQPLTANTSALQRILLNLARKNEGESGPFLSTPPALSSVQAWRDNLYKNSALSTVLSRQSDSIFSKETFRKNENSDEELQRLLQQRISQLSTDTPSTSSPSHAPPVPGDAVATLQKVWTSSPGNSPSSAIDLSKKAHHHVKSALKSSLSSTPVGIPPLRPLPALRRASPESDRTSALPHLPQSSPTRGLPRSSPTRGLPRSSSTCGLPRSSPTGALPRSSPTVGLPRSSPTGGLTRSSPTCRLPLSSPTGGLLLSSPNLTPRRSPTIPVARTSPPPLVQTGDSYDVNLQERARLMAYALIHEASKKHTAVKNDGQYQSTNSSPGSSMLASAAQLNVLLQTLGKPPSEEEAP